VRKYQLFWGKFYFLEEKTNFIEETLTFLKGEKSHFLEDWNPGYLG
jgi:hypothetical protein